MVWHLEVTLYGSRNIEIGYMFAGERLELPRFIVKPDMSLQVNGKAEITDNQQVSGLKWPSVETLSVSFENIDSRDRLKMIEYINYVQFVEPHIVEAYDPLEHPPLYGALTEAGSFLKRNRAGFYYDTKLSWREAR